MTTEHASQAQRLYQAAFNRAPDTLGLQYWTGVLDNGTTLQQVSKGFVLSAEFISTYSANPTADQLVNKFYDNILHRAPEQAGHDYWVGVVNEGLQSHAVDTISQVLVGFSESAENVAGTHVPETTLVGVETAVFA